MTLIKQSKLAVLALLLCCLPIAAHAEGTHADQAIREASKAGSHASASAAHSIAASGQVTSAAAAVPLSVGGAVLGSAGAASRGAARDSLKAASAPIGKPLTITDDAIATVPPDQALKKNTEKNKPENNRL